MCRPHARPERATGNAGVWRRVSRRAVSVARLPLAAALAGALVPSARAAVCDDAAFAAIPEPALPEKGKGVATGESTLGGHEVVGVRFVMESDEPLAAWRKVLAEVDRQDEWVPDQFGYDYAEWVDPSHVYLRFDVGLVFGAIHVRRQLVAAVRQADGPGSYLTCWKMVDHTPFDAQIRSMVTDADWERASAGWWRVVEQGSKVKVGYQWWTEVGHMPTSVMKYGMTSTLPDLMDAFDAYARQVKAP
jgi:hypothetical protein